MSLYCLKCRTNAENKNSKAAKIKIERITLLLKRAVCDSKKLKCIKKEEASRLLRLRIKTPLGKVTTLGKTPLVGPLLF